MPQQIDFSRAFLALTDHEPFPWQVRLFDKMLKGDIPRACDIPTGLGKTSVIAIWLIALAAEKACRLPRRLVYVVNRRTIVDQSTDVVEQICQRLDPKDEAWKEHGNILRSLRDGLKRLAGTDGFPLAVSTLRGELADNHKWRHDPRCPAIVVGTVDMIGSKLLFSGYGDTHRTRPLHAGLLGCDTLFVHDEAHLTPAFGKLLKSVAEQAGRDDDFGFVPMMQVMELSATHRISDGELFTIDKDDRKCGEIKKRFRAKKSLQLHEVEKVGEVSGKIASLALEHGKNGTPERVVVFVRSPQEATKIALALKKGLESNENDRVSVLTGEIRGYERDKLLGLPGMLPFVGEAEASQTVYLVATSAGEVGMDLHADHAVCDLSTLDSMIQRLGRVNRFGQTKAQIDLVHEKAPKEPDRGKTLEIFCNKRSGDKYIDVCPATLLKWLQEEDERDEAFSQKPETVVLTDILTDLWSQTSLNNIPACPEVAPWLHGIEDNLPETWVAWRKEVKLLFDSEIVDEKALAQWFAALRIGSRETLRMPTYRFIEWLRKKREPTPWVQGHAKSPVVVLSAAGEARLVTLDRLADQKLNFATVVLPMELGALDKNGFFDPKGGNKDLDVADEKAARIMLKHKDGKFCFTPVGGEHMCCNSPGDLDDEDKPCHDRDWKTLSSAIQAVEAEYKKKLKLRLKIQDAEEHQGDDDIEEYWLLLLQDVNRKRSGGDSPSPTVKKHNDDVKKIVKEMAASFELPAPLQEALQLAGQHHDTGKASNRWQIAAGYDPNEDDFQPRAKPTPGGIDWRKLYGYRHELGSVVAADKDEKIQKHSERDLILHLIATHHGWARPHFEAGAFPPGTDEKLRAQVHREVMLRYVRLQERFGHWRLAWLESLLRRADAIVSASYNETFPEE